MENGKKLLLFLKPDLAAKILNESKIISFKKGTEILREHQSIKELPVVISGIVKVFSLSIISGTWSCSTPLAICF